MTAFIIFTKNEEKIISQFIDELKANLKTIPNFNFELFLCDDSTDKTQEIAKSKNLQIIQGKGSLGWSYYFVLQYISKKNFENVITLDGDGQTNLSEIPAFLKELEKGFDLVVGSRFLSSSAISYPYSISNFLGVKVLSFIISFCSFQKFTDSHGGLRAMKSKIIKNISFLGTHSYVQETIISAKTQGYKVKELASNWNKRLYGESRVVHSKIKYMKAMSLPLLLRMRAHWIFSILCLILYLIYLEIIFLILALFFSSFEFYKNYLYNRNKKKIKSWLNAK